MLRRLATVAVAVVLVGGSLHADAKWGGIARQLAMGGSQAASGLAVNPFIVDDPAYLLLNPAYQAMYKNYAWMNIAGGQLTGMSTGNNGYGHQNAGLAFGLNREVSVGAIFSYDPSAVNLVSGLIGQIAQRTPQSIPSVLNVWELVGAFDAGDLNVGLGVMYGSSDNSTKASVTGGGSSESEASASLIGFRAGVYVDLGGGSSLDASGALRLTSATDNVSVTPAPTIPIDGEYSASGTEIVLGARARLKASNRFNFVPYALFATASAEPKEDTRPSGITTQPASLEISATAFAVGVGGEFRTPDFYLAGGLSFQSASAEAKVRPPSATSDSTLTVTYTAIPMVNLGSEWWFTEWLAGRMGYQRAIAKVKNESKGSVTTGEQTVSFPHSFVVVGGINPATWDGLVTLGVGFKFGNFSLDATVSEEALRRGFGLVGAQDNINTFGYMTASYNFD